MMIPFLDLKAQYGPIATELKNAIEQTLEGGWFVLGDRLKAFEDEFSAFTSTRYCVGVGSGTDAIGLALRACGVGHGDEVITVPNTAVPTVSAIRMAGAEPVFVDIDPATFTMDPLSLEEVLLAKTKSAAGRVKAIVPVHLYGQCADMDPILEIAARYDCKVIEDACQAHGALYRGKKAGSMGHASAFSFYPSKNLGAYGDGGMVATNDPAVMERLRLLRNYGQKDRYHSIIEGVNSRLDDLQAAVLSIKLKYLEQWTQARRKLAGLYDSRLDVRRLTPPSTSGFSKHVYHLYVIRHPHRDALMRFLKDEGVATLIHYPIPIHLQEAYSWLGLKQGSFPHAEKAAREVLSLPLYPELSERHIEDITELINGFEG